MKKARLTKTVSPILTSMTEADNRLHDLAEATNDRLALIAEMDDEILGIKKRYEHDIASAEVRVAQALEDLENWASANPDLFAKRKSIEFLNGVLGFRTGTPKLVPLNRGWTWEKITDAVCQWLPAFVRSRPEVDKEAILGQRDDATLQAALPRCGLKVTQGEKFFAEPKLTPNEVAA